GVPHGMEATMALVHRDNHVSSGRLSRGSGGGGCSSSTTVKSGSGWRSSTTVTPSWCGRSCPTSTRTRTSRSPRPTAWSGSTPNREQKTEHKEKRGYRSEFRYGEFEREIVLPQGSVADEVKATYDNGVLEVRIPCPKKTHEASTKVPVTRT